MKTTGTIYRFKDFNSYRLIILDEEASICNLAAKKIFGDIIKDMRRGTYREFNIEITPIVKAKRKKI